MDSMDFKIQSFVIRGLHDTRDYDIPIRDNRIVMVGVNGLGKTTVVNLLYLILSQQWNRVLEYTFDSISLTINNEEYKLEQESTTDSIDLRSAGEVLRNQLADRFPREVVQSIPMIIFIRCAYFALSNRQDQISQLLTQETSIPRHICYKIGAYCKIPTRSFRKDDSFSKLEELLKKLTSDCQILYLPTYRRIEKELSLILPDLEVPSSELKTPKDKLLTGTQRHFIECVEFDMEDVEETFLSKKRELVNKARHELKTLVGEYLRDLINGEGQNYEITTLKELKDETIIRILDRVDAGIKQEIRNGECFWDTTIHSYLYKFINDLKKPDAVIKENDQSLAHFFSKLIKLDLAIEEQEQQIERFVEVCNKYLRGKKIVYYKDDSLILVVVPSNFIQLPLRLLSSGEKQIVSLFSHLYLGNLTKVFVIIDEPELSLSLTWQQQLLPDILETGKCSFLAAVTHSPFIFTNSLEQYTTDLSECIKERSLLNESP